jgi:glycogen debranching enzyme
MNAVTASAQNGDLTSIVGFSSKPNANKIGQFKCTGFENGRLATEKTDLVQLSGIFAFSAVATKGALSAYLMGTNEGFDHAVKLYQQEAPDFEGTFRKSSAYFNSLLKNKMMVTTPDTVFNNGYKWAIARTDQFFQETPGLGTSLMAGFGTTARGWNGAQKISGRPGYAWYFGRDAQWSGMAINAYGDWVKVKKVLQVFADFQDLNGKIYHELTSSGAVHYDASDATPLYVVLAANYLKYSGDIAFAKKLWPSLKSAMDFCYSTDTDNDGLIEITNVGHGWIEGGPLFGSHTEIYLAGCWVAALDAATYLSEALKNTSAAKNYRKDADHVRRIIDSEFWSKEGQYFYNGKMEDGSFMKEQTVLSSIPVYFNAVSDSSKAAKTTAAFSGNDYAADWGLRILPQSSPLFNPGAYHAGMVWPLFTGFASLAEYKTGNYVSGFTHIMNNLLLYRNWALGSAEETLNGLTYKPAGICSQQAWSETMILQPIAEGMLGVSCDALSNHITLSPRFPCQWDKVSVDNIAFGTQRFNFLMERGMTSTTYTFKYLSGKAPFNLTFNPSFLSGISIQKVLINGKPTKFQIKSGLESTELMLPEIPIGNDCRVEVLHSGGIGVLPMINEPKPGDVNQGLKILGQEINNNLYTVSVEGLRKGDYEIKLLSKFEIKSIHNGKILSKSGDIYSIGITIPDLSAKYVRQDIVMQLRIDSQE